MFQFSRSDHIPGGKYYVAVYPSNVPHNWKITGSYLWIWRTEYPVYYSLNLKMAKIRRRIVRLCTVVPKKGRDTVVIRQVFVMSVGGDSWRTNSLMPCAAWERSGQWAAFCKLTEETETTYWSQLSDKVMTLYHFFSSLLSQWVAQSV